MERLIQILTNEYALHLMILVGIYIILCQGFNLTFGLGRLLNLSHVAVYAVGAYTTAILSTKLELSFAECLIASIGLCALFSLLLGAISLRLSRDYFAIGTIAFSGVVSALLINWKGLTNGVLGIPGIPRPVLWGLELGDNRSFLAFVSVFLVGALSFLAFFFWGPYSRKLRALAEFEPGALALGIETRLIKNVAFVVGSVTAGIAGSLYATYIYFIDPSSFTLSEMIFVLTIVVLGRPGSFWGGIAATIFLVLLPEPLRFLDIPSSIVGPLRQILYALILFSVVVWNRASIFPIEREI